MERPEAGVAQSRSEVAGQGDRCGASLRWQRDHVYFHRLSEQGESGMENESGQQHLGELANRNRRGKQRKGRRGRETKAGRPRVRGSDLSEPKKKDIPGI